MLSVAEPVSVFSDSISDNVSVLSGVYCNPLLQEVIVKIIVRPKIIRCENMNRNDVINYCLEMTDVFEDYPFPNDDYSVTMKHKKNNKWFALLMNVRGEEYLNIKTPPEYSELLRKSYDYIIPAYHMNKEQSYGLTR